MSSVIRPKFETNETFSECEIGQTGDTGLDCKPCGTFQVNSGATTVSPFSVAPDGLSLKTIGDVEERLADPNYMSELVAAVADIGGATVDEATRRMMTFLLEHDLSRQYNFVGRNGKQEFRALTLFEVVYGGLKKNGMTSQITQKDAEKADSKCLIGSRDLSTASGEKREREFRGETRKTEFRGVRRERERESQRRGERQREERSEERKEIRGEERDRVQRSEERRETEFREVRRGERQSSEESSEEVQRRETEFRGVRRGERQSSEERDRVQRSEERRETRGLRRQREDILEKAKSSEEALEIKLHFGGEKDSASSDNRSSGLFHNSNTDL
ncbi:hypothetical protein WMY93_004161 [Mugilogobius chulae]|uniref:DUF4806 domain-containing protein n=1 Tax=Mugilogobius chulae TaxID=88201 RepID=A0AAW0PMU0_9GOBI